ncbi:family 1 glycosylhydrolase [Novosphingobium sp. FSY-8]|uniref:Family 1 glycosylhydrolase n=1 Tax=Novosphingobium ovatum TaxID=1908523 RepID=A0ABW9XDA7_9SPHN|nr:family 1 glycosylhydrolase [Novosphingobium ovatum]NBC36504.1 family 1 glycosylhydrolase [Novosphingobium ovatum]
MFDRRTIMAGVAALAAGQAVTDPAQAARRKPAPKPAPAGLPAGGAFPRGFLWGVATAGHQVEGNNTASDTWFMEQVKPGVFAEPSGDACNSFALWRTDMDLVRDMGLNTYRFSLEWARIEPEEGQFSIAMLNHYKAMIAGARERGLRPLVTFNHFTCPRWFAAKGGWTNPQSPALFARYAERAARHLAADISHATTLNEPNLPTMLSVILPPPVLGMQEAMLAAAAKALNVPKFAAGNVMGRDDILPSTRNMVAAHKAGRDAIKAVRPDLPVGVSLSMFDDQEEKAGKPSIRDAMRAMFYGPWLEAVRGDDFLGVQNYERVIWGEKARVPAPAGAVLNWSGTEVYAASLGGAVRYAHQATGLPIFVTEHGVGSDDDAVRASFIPGALNSLRSAMADGVPVLGYVHWSLIDNFEWIFGYRPKYGLHSVDRTSFARTAKPSAAVLSAIARANSL